MNVKQIPNYYVKGIQLAETTFQNISINNQCVEFTIHLSNLDGKKSFIILKDSRPEVIRYALKVSSYTENPERKSFFELFKNEVQKPAIVFIEKGERHKQSWLYCLHLSTAHSGEDQKSFLAELSFRRQEIPPYSFSERHSGLVWGIVGEMQYQNYSIHTYVIIVGGDSNSGKGRFIAKVKEYNQSKFFMVVDDQIQKMTYQEARNAGILN